MKNIGIFLIIAAGATLLLPYLGVQMIIFAWIDSWGAATGLAIRGGMAALGILLIWLGRDGGSRS